LLKKDEEVSNSHLTESSSELGTATKTATTTAGKSSKAKPATTENK